MTAVAYMATLADPLTAAHQIFGLLRATAWWFQKPNTVRAEAALKLDDNNRIWGA